MIESIFNFVALALIKGAKWSHLTYNEINVIFYYGIIPLTWCILIDILLGYPITTILFLILWMVVFLMVRKKFSAWCNHIFSLSQKFLCFFGEYETSSVVICVFIPILIYIALIVLVIQRYV